MGSFLNSRIIPRRVQNCTPEKRLTRLESPLHIIKGESVMRRWLFVALAVLSFGASIVAQMADQEVMKAEQAKLDARRKGDSDAHGRLISDDFGQISTTGAVQDKKYATTRPAAAKLDARDHKVQVFGDVAIVTATQ